MVPSKISNKDNREINHVTSLSKSQQKAMVGNKVFPFLYTYTKAEPLTPTPLTENSTGLAKIADQDTCLCHGLRLINKIGLNNALVKS